MDTRLYIDNAMMIASGEYPEKSLKLEFRAISSLQSYVMELRKDHEDHTGRYSLGDIESSLMTLVSRQSHSDVFKASVKDARERTLRYISMSDRLVGDVLYWDLLSPDERLQTCNLVMKEINVVFRDHERLPPSNKPIIEGTYEDKMKSFLDGKGNVGAYVPTVWATSRRNIDGIPEIQVNTHGKSFFEDPYHVLAGLYGEYINLIYNDLVKINNMFFNASRQTFGFDIELLDIARSEGGFIDPYLDHFHEAQFTTSLINAEKTAFKEGLKTVVEEEAPHIPARHRKVVKVGNFFGALLGRHP